MTTKLIILWCGGVGIHPLMMHGIFFRKPPLILPGDVEPLAKKVTYMLMGKIVLKNGISSTCGISFHPFARQNDDL